MWTPKKWIFTLLPWFYFIHFLFFAVDIKISLICNLLLEELIDLYQPSPFLHALLNTNQEQLLVLLSWGCCVNPWAILVEKCSKLQNQRESSRQQRFRPLSQLLIHSAKSEMWSCLPDLPGGNSIPFLFLTMWKRNGSFNGILQVIHWHRGSCELRGEAQPPCVPNQLSRKEQHQCTDHYPNPELWEYTVWLLCPDLLHKFIGN